MTVIGRQRFTRDDPCPVCGGFDQAPRGQGERCFGFVSEDRRFAHCTRSEHAGNLPVENESQTYAHFLAGDCRCGAEHRTLAPTPSRPPTAPRIVATYDYRDETGALVYQAVRYDPKTFKVRRSDGKGGWIWNLQGVRRVLYNLPEVLAVARMGWRVYPVEGEKDADNLIRLGLCATTNVFGARTEWRDEDSEALRGAEVVAIADKDEPGRKHAFNIAASCLGRAKSVKVTELPGEHVKDVSDWLSAGGTKADLERIADEAPIWTRPAGELVELRARDDDDSQGPDSVPSEPRCSKEHGVITCSCAAPTFLTFEFDRFSTTRDDLTAEVVVYSTVPGLRRELLRRRLPLLGTRAVPDFAKDLKAKLRDQKITDLDALLESVIQQAIRLNREGEPGQYVRDIPLPQGDGLLLPFVVAGRNGSLLYGDPGEGKSTIAAITAAAIHLGRADLLGMTPAKQLRCAYFNWEDDGSELRSRYGQMFGDDLPDILHVECRGALWDEADRLRRIVKENGIEFAVFDSVGLACGGLKPDESESALRFANAFKALEIGGLLIAHKAKAEQEDSPFGSMFWRATARSVWRVRKHQEISESTYTVGLYQNKLNAGPKPPPMALRISYEKGRLTAMRTDLGDDVELSEHLETWVRLRDAVARDGPMTYAEASNATGISPDTARKTFSRYTRIFVRYEDTRGVRWGLRARQSEPGQSA